MARPSWSNGLARVALLRVALRTRRDPVAEHLPLRRWAEGQVPLHYGSDVSSTGAGAPEEPRLRVLKAKGLRLRVDSPGGRGGNRTLDTGLMEGLRIEYKGTAL
jgi:hypothetical protein